MASVLAPPGTGHHLYSSLNICDVVSRIMNQIWRDPLQPPAKLLKHFFIRLLGCSHEVSWQQTRKKRKRKKLSWLFASCLVFNLVPSMEDEIEKEFEISNQDLSPAGEKAIFVFQANMLKSSGNAAQMQLL